MMCATALLSSCHIYKAYDRPEDIDASGLYRDPVSETDTLASDTANMGNLPWKELFRDAQLQALIEQGLEKNVDMQTAILRVEEAKVMLTSAKLSYLPSINLAPQGTITTMDHSPNAKAYSLPLSASCRTKASVAGCSLFTITTISSAPFALKILIRRSTIASPFNRTKGLGSDTPSSASRDPSPAAIMANFIISIPNVTGTNAVTLFFLGRKSRKYFAISPCRLVLWNILILL